MNSETILGFNKDLNIRIRLKKRQRIQFQERSFNLGTICTLRQQKTGWLGFGMRQFFIPQWVSTE